ncbi:MAG: hypothetical protein ACI84C_001316 [Flavobacteriales bacterium]|jgi:hypothetical protein
MKELIAFAFIAFQLSLNTTATLKQISTILELIKFFIFNAFFGLTIL